MGKGGGQQQQQPTATTVTNTNLPAYAQPYVEKLFGQAGALTDINQNPYQQYGGQRLADFTPMQQQAFNTIGGMQVSPQTQQATGLAGAAGLGSLGAGQNYNRMATDPGAMQAFMSPYQQNVTDYQKQQAVMDYGRQLPGMGAAASRAGAFGGSRQAIVEGEGQRNLQNQLAGIQATGSQNAFQNAQQAQQFGSSLGLQGYNQALQGASTLGQLGQNQYQQQTGINAAQQQAGAQQQAFNQQGLSNQYQDFLNRQNYPYQQLGFMSDIIRGTPTGGITTKQESQVAPSMFSQIAGSLGGLGSLAGAYNAFGKAEGGEIKGYAEGGAVEHFDGGGLASLPNAAEMLAAKNIGAGKASLDGELALGGDLTRLLMASMQLKETQAKLEIAKLASGANPQTNVAQDIAMQQQQLDQGQQPQQMAQAPQQGMPPQQMDQGQQPPQQSGLASLPSQNFNPENYAGGGIIAFGAGGDTDDTKQLKAAVEELRAGEGQRQADAAKIRGRELMPNGGGMLTSDKLLGNSFSNPIANLASVDSELRRKDITPEIRTVLLAERNNLVAQIESSGGSAQAAGTAPVSPERALQIENDRRGLQNAGIATLKPAAAAADLLGGPYNYLSQKAADAANYIGIPRAGRALGIYDSDVDRVSLPKIGSGTNTPFYDIIRRKEAELAPLTELPKPTPIEAKATSAAPNKTATSAPLPPIPGIPGALPRGATNTRPYPEGSRYAPASPLAPFANQDAAQAAADAQANETNIRTPALNNAAQATAQKAAPAPTAYAGIGLSPEQVKQLMDEAVNPVKLTPQQRADRMAQIAEDRKAYGIDDEKSDKLKLKELTTQAAEAKKSRDVGLWISAAQGFFEMAGRTGPGSQNALVNFAKGAGVSSKEAEKVLDIYRKSESDLSKAKIGMEEARQNRNERAYDRFKTENDKLEMSRERAITTLLTHDTQAKVAQAIRDNTAESRKARDDETARHNKAQEDRDRERLEAAKKIASDTAFKNSPNYKALQNALQIIDSKAQAKNADHNVIHAERVKIENRINALRREFDKTHNVRGAAGNGVLQPGEGGVLNYVPRG